MLKVGARRWWVVLPVLVVLGLISFVIVGKVNTSYKAKAEMVVLGPNQTISIGVDNVEIVNDENPFIVGDGTTMARFLPLALSGPEYRDQLEAEGLSGSFTLDPDNRAPIVHIDVVGENAAVAEATAVRIFDLAGEWVDDAQARANAPEGERLTVSLLSVSDATEDSGPVRIAAAGLGVLTLVVAFGLAVLVDLRLRRRAAALASVDADEVDERPGADVAFADRLVAAIEARLSTSTPAEGAAPANGHANGHTNGATQPDAEPAERAPGEVTRSGRWGNRTS